MKTYFQNFLCETLCVVLDRRLSFIYNIHELFISNQLRDEFFVTFSISHSIFEIYVEFNSKILFSNIINVFPRFTFTTFWNRYKTAKTFYYFCCEIVCSNILF